MDLGRSFSYVFDDEEWVSKILLTAVISIIPILNLALYGWVVELMRNMLRGEEHPLPDWSNFEQKFSAGLHYLVGSLVYFLPVFVLMLPMMLFAFMADSNSNLETIGILLSCVISVAVFAYAIVASAGLYMGMVRYALRPELASYLAIRQNLGLALRHAATLATLVLFLALVSLILGVFGWIPCIGWLAALALGTPVVSHLAGQAAIQIVGSEKRKRSEM